MTAHVAFETVDPGIPATMSPKAIGELLREDVGFGEAVFSDDLEMKAVSGRYSIEEAGVLAIEAGCDLVLVCSDLKAAARVRHALATEADRSPSFHARLNEARSRADAATSESPSSKRGYPLASASTRRDSRSSV